MRLTASASADRAIAAALLLSVPSPLLVAAWTATSDSQVLSRADAALAKSGTVDLFKPVAYGTDQRGRWVAVTLMYIAGVIGAPEPGRDIRISATVRF